MEVGRVAVNGPGYNGSGFRLMRITSAKQVIGALSSVTGWIPARIVPYALALVAALAATLVKLGVEVATAQHTANFVVFPAAIIITAWRGGLWPGVCCTLVSVLSIDYFFSDSPQELLNTSPATNVNLLFFIADGLSISLICDALRRSRAESATLESEAKQALVHAQKAASDAAAAKSFGDASERRFQRLFDSNIVSIYMAEPGGKILQANDAFRKLIGFAASDLDAGQCDWRKMTPPDHFRRDAEAFAEIGQTGVCQPYEKEFLRADGTRVPVLLGCAETDTDGRLICFAADLSEQRQVTQRLATAMAAVEAGSRAKSEFVANISHELRTPMNAILGMTELALADDLPPRTRGFLETAKTSADALLNLLNDLLDFSRLETGQFSMRPQPFRMADVCEEAIRTLSLRAQEKQLELDWVVSGDTPKWLLGDAARLRQIIVNLVGNSIKFTEHGHVRLSVELAEMKESVAHLRLCVADTGIGIDPADQKRIFEAFTQVDASTTRRYAGSGLGLSITRQLVTQMGGHIWVESEVNQGTTFHCFLPFPQCEAPMDSADRNRRSPSRPRRARPLHVLVGEDTPANQKLVAAILDRYGHTCEIAPDGVELLALLAKRQYDAILLDVQMPRKDGIQTAIEVRGLQDRRVADIPIVAMTAHALDSDRERCLAAGMNDYVSKPLSARRLVDILESVVGECGDSPPHSTPLQEFASPPLPPHQPPATPMITCFDYEESLKRLGDDKELFCAMARCFVEDADGLLREIATGNQRGEAPRVERAAHSLKGLAATFSAAAVVSRAQFIEQCGRQADLTRARAVLPDLMEETEKLKTALNPYATNGAELPTQEA